MEYGHHSAYREVVFPKVKCKLNSVKVRTEYMVNSNVFWEESAVLKENAPWANLH